MKRALVVVAAVVLAVVGAVAVLAYARSADQRALAGQEAREVYVTTREVPAGTSAQDALDSGLLQTALVAAKGVPDGAMTEVTPENLKAMRAALQRLRIRRARCCFSTAARPRRAFPSTCRRSAATSTLSPATSSTVRQALERSGAAMTCSSRCRPGMAGGR